MARISFAGMKTEVTYRLGNHNYTNFDGRVEEWIKAAYYHCATAFEHVELHATDTSETLSTGTSTVDLATDCFLVFGVAFYDVGTTDFRKWLEGRHFRFIQSNFTETNTEPDSYARFADTLQFNCNSDANYPVLIKYYKEPAEPVFDTTTSSLGVAWDEIIQRFAVAYGFGALMRKDQELQELQLVSQMVAAQPNPPLNVDIAVDRPTRRLTDASLAGSLG